MTNDDEDDYVACRPCPVSEWCKLHQIFDAET
jgi:hypothetical protein